MKKTIRIAVSLIMVFALAYPAFAQEVVSCNDVQTDSGVVTRIVNTKWISDYQVFYTSYSAVPSTYYYSVWDAIDGSAYSGTLNLYQITKVTGGWMAHYSGNVVGRI